MFSSGIERGEWHEIDEFMLHRKNENKMFTTAYLNAKPRLIFTEEGQKGLLLRREGDSVSSQQYIDMLPLFRFFNYKCLSR